MYSRILKGIYSSGTICRNINNSLKSCFRAETYRQNLNSTNTQDLVPSHCSHTHHIASALMFTLSNTRIRCSSISSSAVLYNPGWTLHYLWISFQVIKINRSLSKQFNYLSLDLFLLRVPISLDVNTFLAIPLSSIDQLILRY